MGQPELCKAERDERTITMVVMGVIVPLILLCFAQDAWISEQAKWPVGYRSGDWDEVEGLVAKCMGIVYLGISVVCVSHWLLRHFRFYGLCLCGIVLGSLLFFGGVIAGLVFMA